MASREVTVVFLGDAAQYEATLERMGVATDAAGDAIADKFGAAGASASGKFGDALDEGTSKIGNLFKKLGEQASQFGLPFSSNLTKIGNDLNNVETKGKGVVSAMTALGAVGIAALAGVAAESVHLADGFDKAQAALKTAVTNSGTTWSKYSSQIGAATKTSGALVTGNAQEVEEALTTITTATNNPKQALKDLALAENMAALKHESLADASNQLSKILGGNERTIKNWGLNLNIGSTSLNAVQKAEEALQSAQLSQKTVQAEVNDGQLQGVAASSAQEKAALSVRNATLNLTEDQKSLGDVMDALNQRTKNAATNLGSTLAGQMTIAKNTVHDLGIQFGEFLVPYIDKVISAGAKLISWIVSCKPVAIALATAIGGPLAASMTLAAGRAMLGMVSSLGKLTIGFAQAGASALSHIPVIGTVFQTSSNEAVAATMKQISALDIMTEDQIASLATQENQWKQYAVVTTASANVVLAETGEIDAVLKGVAQVATEQAAVFGNALHSMGVSAQQSAAIVAGADTEMVASADAASTGIKVALGSTGVGLILVGLGIAATELMTHWNTAWSNMKANAQTAANFIINNAINPMISAFDNFISGVTLGFVHLGGQISDIQQSYAALAQTAANAEVQMAQQNQSSINAQNNAAAHAGFSSNSAYDKTQIANIQAMLKAGNITKAQAAQQETAVETQNPVGPSSIQNQNNVAQQVSSFMSSQGFNMTAIAGMLGNAQQESSMNPNTPGGGLFQQVSNFGQGTGGSLENQLQTMLPQIESLKTSMNAATTPAQAAAIFEQAFEKAGVPAMANRENYATQAYTMLNGGTPGSTLTPLGATPTPTGGAGTTTITAGEAAMEVAAKKFQGILQRAIAGGTSFSQQGKTVSTLASATSSANSAQATALENSLNATQNPALVGLAQSIETTWQNATTKLTTIIDSDTTKGQSELQKLQSAQNATSLSSIEDATTSAQKASLNDLVNELVSTHQKALETLAKQLELNWSSTMASLKSIKGDISQALKADAISNAASIVAINTQAAGSAGQSATQVSGLQSQQTSDQLSAAATSIQDAAKIQTDQAQAQTTAITDAMNISSASAQAQVQQITDAAKLMSDAAQIEVNSINAQTTAAHDTTSAMVQAIQNQTQTQVDTLGERGLYGLQLVAQQAKVVLDQQVATDDANIAAAQAHLDQVTAQTNQNVALAQQKADTDQAAENATVAAAQMNALITQQANDAAVATATANADLVQQTQDAAVASAQANSDAVQIQSAIQMAAANQNNFNAQLQAQADQNNAAIAQSNSQFVTGSAMEADEYQSQLLQAQATQITNNGAQVLQAITNQTNANNQNASNALQQAQSTATQAEARAQAQLSAAQSAASVSNATATAAATAAQNAAAIQAAQDAMALSTAQNTASIQQSLAQQQLSAIQSQASLTEAKLTSIVNIDQELANVEYAGSGINIYVTGLPADNAAAIGAATSYALRYQVS